MFFSLKIALLQLRRAQRLYCMRQRLNNIAYTVRRGHELGIRAIDSIALLVPGTARKMVLEMELERERAEDDELLRKICDWYFARLQRLAHEKQPHATRLFDRLQRTRYGTLRFRAARRALDRVLAA